MSSEGPMFSFQEPKPKTERDYTLSILLKEVCAKSPKLISYIWHIYLVDISYKKEIIF